MNCGLRTGVEYDMLFVGKKKLVGVDVKWCSAYLVLIKQAHLLLMLDNLPLRLDNLPPRLIIFH